MSVRTEPRFTRDVDVCIAVEDDPEAERLVASLRAAGYRVVAIVEQEQTGRIATVRLTAGRGEDGIVLRVPLRSTSLSTLVRHAPRAKLCKQAVQEFLDLVKEYEQCVQKPATKSVKSGRRSNKRTRKKS